MERNKCIAMLLAGGQGSRLGCLTTDIAKPALSFGGKYRIIDFSLSNCINSGIDTVGVLTQYKPFLLNTYVGIGSAWDLDSDQGGMHILPPYVGAEGGAWYKGTANAIYQNIDFIDNYEPEYVLILSGDHIYKMDYSKMLEEHIEKNADLTIAVLEVPLNEANRFGIMSVDFEGRVTKFAEKPENPESNLASMGIYIFSWPQLRAALIEDEATENSSKDFGKNIIPKMLADKKRLFSHRFKGYWKDVGTIPSYYEANMELLAPNHELDIFSSHFRVFSNTDILPPQFIGTSAEVNDSLVSNGCTILGSISGSILGQGVYVGEGATVRDSILLPYSRVEVGSTITKSIIGERAVIGRDCVLGAKAQSLTNDGITVVANNYHMADDVSIEAGKDIK